MTLLPIALVGLSASFSAAYKLSKAMLLTTTSRRKVTKVHATAIEMLQFLLIFAGLAASSSSIESLRQCLIFHSMRLPVSTGATMLNTIVTYVLAIFAIDIIDNKIQLGKWRHPVQPQTLLLTRSLLLPHTIKTRHLPSRKIPRRPRARSEPVTPRMLGRTRPPLGSVKKLVLGIEEKTASKVQTPSIAVKRSAMEPVKKEAMLPFTPKSWKHGHEAVHGTPGLLWTCEVSPVGESFEVVELSGKQTARYAAERLNRRRVAPGDNCNGSPAPRNVEESGNEGSLVQDDRIRARANST